VREETLTRGWLSWAAALVLLVGCGQANDGEPPRPDGDATSDGGADAEGEDVDAGPGRPVTGSWVNTRINPQGRTPSPRDLSRYEIGVWTQGRSPRYVAGSGSKDGSFVVPDVPSGRFLLILKLGDGVPSCVASDGNVRAFDLGEEIPGEPVSSEPLLGPKSNIALTLTNLAPWGVGDSLLLVRNLASTFGFRGSFFQPGVTMGTLSVPYEHRLGIDGPGRGDEMLILQQGSTVTADGLTIWTTRAAGKTKALHTVDGQTVMASESLQALPADGVVAFDVRRSQFLPFAPGEPSASGDPSVEIDMGRSLPGMNDLGTFDTSLIETTDGVTDVQIDARESNPYPATWTRFAHATVLFPISMFVPGGMRPLVDAARMHVADRDEVLKAAPIVPRLGPPRAPQVAGRPAEVPQIGVGLTPTLSWSAPTLGQPTLYQIFVSRIDVGVDATDTSTLASIATDQTSFTVPPGVLERGVWYRFLVYAIAGNDTHVSTPYRTSVPWADASLFSGRFTP
jgi:hypothetical protein